MKDLGLTDEQFYLAVKLGMETDEKKYFEQIIVIDNFIVFKKLMEKRNAQIEEEAYKRYKIDSVNKVNSSIQQQLDNTNKSNILTNQPNNCGKPDNSSKMTSSKQINPISKSIDLSDGI